MPRQDYAFPFRIDPVSGQAARAHYADHVRQMIRQVLLTTPGERVNRPEFGCGLRQLLFAPRSEALITTTRTIVRSALTRWLGGQIEVIAVNVASPESESEGSLLLIEIEYRLIETRSNQRLEVRILA